MKEITYVLMLVTIMGCNRGDRTVAELDFGAIEAKASELMMRESVQGLALAVIDQGEVAHVKTFGYRNTEKNLPLTEHTIMYGASFTKTAFAYMVLQLVDEGRLDLDSTVEKLLPQPLPAYQDEDNDFSDLASDERWKKLTPRILLSHTTGFANFRWLEEDNKLRFHHDPGTRYGYSGEGYYIMQLILEEGLALNVGEEMQRRIFDRFQMPNTSMQWRPDFAENLADGYRIDGSMEPHDERSSVSAAGSMDTSIRDQANMWAGIVSGEGLSRASRSALVSPQIPISTAHQFPTLWNDVNPQLADLALSAGLGLVTFNKQGLAWFKGGHNEWTGNFVLCQEEGKRCVVMMSNDVRAERIYPMLGDFILGDTGMPWTWEYGWLDD